MNRKQRRADKKSRPLGQSAPSSQEVQGLADLFSGGRYAEAVEFARQVVHRYPRHGFAWKVMGAALVQMGLMVDALAPMEQAVALLPGDAEAHFNLGVNLRELDQFAAAAACCRRSLELRRDDAAALNNLAVNLRDLGQFEAAVAGYRRALLVKPDYADVYGNLGVDLVALGRPEQALAGFLRQSLLDPDNGGVRHQIASLTGVTTERAPADYIESMFDSYAHQFDHRLQKTLNYAVPQKLAALLRHHPPASGGSWQILDLGCGTGLFGLEVAGAAACLVGVDLSRKMLNKAQARKIYHRLVHADLVSTLRSEPPSTYDVIAAADVLIYCGELEEIVMQSARLLRPGGALTFSIETDGQPGPSYRLQPTGRYSHSPSYIEALAEANGLAVAAASATGIRLENGQEQPGFLFLLRKI